MNSSANFIKLKNEFFSTPYLDSPLDDWFDL